MVNLMRPILDALAGIAARAERNDSPCAAALPAISRE
jgi:hypothetical protein